MKTKTMLIILSCYSTLHLQTNPKAQNLRQGIVMKTSFKTRVSRMGLGIFVNISIFVMKYYFFSVCLYSPFFSNLLNQNLHKT